MSSTREYRNAGAIEDAVAVIGCAITVAESLVDALASVLPDDYPTYDVREALELVRNAHECAQEAVQA